MLFNVANGLYACRVMFRELKKDIATGRAFDIEVQGTTVNAHFIAPPYNNVVVQDYPNIVVTDGTFKIRFVGMEQYG